MKRNLNVFARGIWDPDTKGKDFVAIFGSVDFNAPEPNHLAGERLVQRFVADKDERVICLGGWKDIN